MLRRIKQSFMKNWRYWVLGACAFVISGCATSAELLSQYEQKFQAGDFKEATKISQEKKDDILWALQGGTSLRMQKSYKESIDKFDFADNQFKKYEEELLAGTLLGRAGAVLINDTILDYEGRVYDKVMTNTYKAINFMMLGDHENARVEFNRAIDRQRMAKDYFEKEIAELENK